MHDPATVMARLSALEEELAERQNAYEEAAEVLHMLKRDWERRLATVLLTCPRDMKVDERKATALVTLAAADDNIYARYVEAEAAYEAQKAAINVLSTRVGIGQSLLRAMTREAFSPGPQPSWSRAA